VCDGVDVRRVVVGQCSAYSIIDCVEILWPQIPWGFYTFTIN
jgi:hypothetical protein